MTTITYKNGLVAVDSQCSFQSTYVRSTKLFSLKSGGAIAVCGDAGMGDAFFDWYNNGQTGEKPQPFISPKEDDVSFGALVVLPSDNDTFDLKYWDEAYLPFSLEEGPLAFGSGMAAGLSALHVGADAVEAALASCLCDKHSSAPVSSYDIRLKRWGRYNDLKHYREVKADYLGTDG